MKNDIKISVIVTTHNWPLALQKVLMALFEQTILNFEIIVADDGSRNETKTMIAALKPHSPIPLTHVWQVDEGSRLAKIRNKAIFKAKGDYIVFLDGDSVPERHFIRNHCRLRRWGHFVVGDSVSLSEAFTQQVLNDNLPLHRFTLWDWFLHRQKDHVNHFISFIKLPLGPCRDLFPTQWKGADGCNLAVFKSDLVRVNGWDESLLEGGYEDSDLIIRLIRSNLKRRSARFKVLVMHLWHPEHDNSRVSHSVDVFRNSQQRPIYAKIGLDQYRVHNQIHIHEVKSNEVSVT